MDKPLPSSSASEVKLRFAPSPNGWLHLGHAFSALFTARAAERLGGLFLLRIEDIDLTRSKAEFVEGILEDLRWLGLDWPEPPMRQSQRFPIYGKVAERLKQRGLLYPCFCSRAEVAKEAAGADPDGAPLYGGRCKGLSEADVAQRKADGIPLQWRLDMQRAIAAAGQIAIIEAPASGIDAIWSEAQVREAAPARWGDAVLVRKETPTSYHLSVVVDDAAQGISQVTRGADLKAATDLHVLLQALLDLPSPLYCHHALLSDADGQKLAKSKGSPSLRDLREKGIPAVDIRSQLGFCDIDI
jgi:glutamyl-Q tRNA(Asp) synthetase